MEEGFDLLKGQVLHALSDQVHFQVSCPRLVGDSRRPSLCHSFTVSTKPMFPLKQVQDYLSLALYFNLKQHQLTLFIETIDVKIVNNLIHDITCGLIQDHSSYHEFSPKQFIKQQTQTWESILQTESFENLNIVGVFGQELFSNSTLQKHEVFVPDMRLACHSLNYFKISKSEFLNLASHGINLVQHGHFFRWNIESSGLCCLSLEERRLRGQSGSEPKHFSQNRGVRLCTGLGVEF